MSERTKHLLQTNLSRLVLVLGGVLVGMGLLGSASLAADIPIGFMFIVGAWMASINAEEAVRRGEAKGGV